MESRATLPALVCGHSREVLMGNDTGEVDNHFLLAVGRLDVFLEESLDYCDIARAVDLERLLQILYGYIKHPFLFE